MPESFEGLRQKLLELLNAARAQTPEHHKSYWYHRPLENFPPRTVRIPEEFDGGAEIAIACTQTELGAKAQRELVDRWCRVLPTLPVRNVWLQTKASQQLLDAVCEIPSLEGLNISWSGIGDLNPLLRSAQLRYLRIGTCPSVADLRVFEKLPHLRWLELSLPRAVMDLEWVRCLTQLEGLSVVGWKRQRISSLQPLSGLNGLRWLHLGGIRTDDSSLLPLASLQSLKYLAIGNLFPMPEFARLSRRLPKTDCEWFGPGRVCGDCRRCRSKTVMITGKGISSLCPTCDSAKWDRVVDAFIAAAQTA